MAVVNYNDLLNLAKELQKEGKIDVKSPITNTSETKKEVDPLVELANEQFKKDMEVYNEAKNLKFNPSKPDDLYKLDSIVDYYDKMSKATNMNVKEFEPIVKYYNDCLSYLNKLAEQYNTTSDEQQRYELGLALQSWKDKINSSSAFNRISKETKNKGKNTSGGQGLYGNIPTENPYSENWEKFDKQKERWENGIKNLNVARDKKTLDDYNAKVKEINKAKEQNTIEPIVDPTPEPNVEPVENPTVEPTPVENPNTDEWGHAIEQVDNTPTEMDSEIDRLNKDLANGITSINITKDASGNPVINGHLGYSLDDKNIKDNEGIQKLVNEYLNKYLTPFLQSSSFTNKQKIDALDDFFQNNPHYTNADLYNLVKFKNYLYSSINEILTSSLSDEEKYNRLNLIASQYESYANDFKSLLPLSNMWDDFQIDKDLSKKGMLRLAIDTSVDGEALNKALDMYLSNKKIYDDAIANYESLVKSYTPQKLEDIGQEYGDIASKYNAQKVDKQITNTATGLGQGGAIATQLGNEAQYQNYAENLAENQMAQTDTATDYAQSKLNNEYAKVQNAYNNAMQAENAVMGEVDKNQADINAYLTKQGVDLATDKYNYERNMQPVNIATTIGNGVVNAVDKIKNK